MPNKIFLRIENLILGVANFLEGGGANLFRRGGGQIFFWRKGRTHTPQRTKNSTKNSTNQNAQTPQLTIPEVHGRHHYCY